MDWVLGSFKFRGRDFQAWHFDVAQDSGAGGGDGSDDGEDATHQMNGAEEEALEDASGEIGAVLWSDTAIAMLQWLQDTQKSYRGCKVLELGAGCGYVGLALAADGADVTITEIEVLQPLLARNAELSRAAGHRTSQCTLDWEEEVPAGLRADFDVVVGCELLYDSASPTALARMIQHFVVGDTEFRLGVNLGRDGGRGFRTLLGLLEGHFLMSQTNMPGMTMLLARRK